MKNIGFDRLSDRMFLYVDMAADSWVAGRRGALCRYVFGIGVEMCLNFRP